MVNALPRKRDATVADVAREAKVSKAQAARALGGYGAVSEDVKSRVLQAAATLEYRPNRLAQSMNTGKSKTIGVIVGDIENPYFGLAMRGIYDAAKESGYSVILINTSEQHEAEVEGVQILQDNRVDGFIIAPTLAPDVSHLHAIVESGRPLVLLDRQIAGLETDFVSCDSEEAAYEAASALLAVGHRRIGFISTTKTNSDNYREGLNLGITPVADRIAGIKRAFGSFDLELPEELIRLNAGDAAGIRSVVSELMAGPARATAIIASDSLIAASALEELRSLSLNIPEDLSFIMFDDFPWTRVVTPPLTVVSQPIYELGVGATEILRSRMQSLEPPALPVFTSQLLMRDSVGKPPLLSKVE